MFCNSIAEFTIALSRSLLSRVTHTVARVRYGALYVYGPWKFHHGYPTYVFCLPSGKECRVFREGNIWYNSGWSSGNFSKFRQIDHDDRSDPNLPPSGVGWTRCEDGTPSTISFSVAPGFEKKLEEASGTCSLLFNRLARGLYVLRIIQAVPLSAMGCTLTHVWALLQLSGRELKHDRHNSAFRLRANQSSGSSSYLNPSFLKTSMAFPSWLILVN